MIFYILLNHAVSVFLGINLLTTLTFDNEIVSYMYGGAKEDVFIKVTNQGRTLALKPINIESLSNLLVITRKRKYYFDLKFSKDNPHKFVEIKHGIINHALTSVLKINKVEVLEGNTSTLILNQSGKPVMVNGVKVKNKEYFSKGIPIFVNEKRILN